MPQLAGDADESDLGGDSLHPEWVNPISYC